MGKQTYMYEGFFLLGFSETEQGAHTLSNQININDTYGLSISIYVFICVHIYKYIHIHEDEFIKHRLP